MWNRTSPYKNDNIRNKNAEDAEQEATEEPAQDDYQEENNEQ